MRNIWAFVLLGVAVMNNIGCTSTDSVELPQRNLRYEFVRFVPGINDTVRYVKTPWAVVVETPYGTLSVPEFHRRNTEDWRARSGAVTVQLDRYLTGMHHDSKSDDVPILIVYKDPVPRRLYTSVHDVSERSASLARIEATLGDTSVALSGDLLQYQFVQRKRSRRIPVIFGSAPTSEIRNLSRHEGIALVDLDLPVPNGPENFDAAPLFATDPFTDQVNNQGFAGSDVKVGLAEIQLCGVYDAHESVSLNNAVVHRQAPPSCSMSTDCAQYGCDRCVNSKCVHTHTSWVA
jgi:hypothetical protein